MTDYDNLRAAFNIFDKYPHEKGVYAEHDVIYAGPDFVTQDDLAELAALGWIPNREGGAGFLRFT